MKDAAPLRGELFWCDEWALSEAFLLPIAARGLHREMLTAAWPKGAKLPNDPAKIRKAIGATLKEWRALWPAVAHLWVLVDGHLVNPQQVETYRAAVRHQEKLHNRAVKAAAARWSKPAPQGEGADANAHAYAYAQAMPTVTVTEDLHDRYRSAGPSRAFVREDGAPKEQASDWLRCVAIAHLVMDEDPGNPQNWTAELKARCREQGIDCFVFAGEGPQQRPLYARVLDYVEGVRKRRLEKAARRVMA